jgi:hypothetical protein
MKKAGYLFYLSILIGCSGQQGPDHRAIKAEIERLIEIQESTYGDKSPEAREKLASTLSDSLLFVGGDDGGMATTAEQYMGDLADGYITKPYEKFFRIYDNMVIVTAKLQAYKKLSNDTLLLNYRTTKVFVKQGDQWKMSYFAHASLPVVYTKVATVDPKRLNDYVGVYQLEPGVIDSVSASGGKLYSTIAGAEAAELIPVNDSTFRGEGYFGHAVFSKNKSGKVTHYYFEWNDGQRINFPRIR